MSGVEDGTRASALGDGLPPAMVELVRILCEEGGVDAETARSVFAAIEPGAVLETVPHAWLMWAWEQGDGLPLTPLRDHMGRADHGAIADSVIALHRRVLAGGTVERAEWRRVRTASAGDYPHGHPIHIALSAAWDYRSAPGTVVDVVDAWRDALASHRFDEIGHDAAASEALWRNINDLQTAYFESVLGPAPKEGDESELAQAWWENSRPLNDKFFENYKDPIYLRWQGAREKFEADKQALATVGLEALLRLARQR
nr:hypothetical protein [uncultured Duganella sp.]